MENVHELLKSNAKAKEIYEKEKPKYITSITSYPYQPELVRCVKIYTIDKLAWFNTKNTVLNIGGWYRSTDKDRATTMEYNLHMVDEWLKEYILYHAGFKFSSNHRMFERRNYSQF